MLALNAALQQIQLPLERGRVQLCGLEKKKKKKKEHLARLLRRTETALGG